MFFVLMICFTVLSRAADQAGIAVVTTQRPDNMMIAHEVKTTGKIVQNQELAVTTEPDQRVTAIHVNEGERVNKGDLLFELDMTLLEEKILNQQQEMEKQQLQVKDAQSQKDISAQQKANEQAQASEQYSLATGKAGVQLSRAKEQLAEAKKALQKFRKSSGAAPEESAVEEELEKTCEEKQEAYLQAEQELSSLQWQIEKAVDEALQQAKSQASLIPNSTVFTQSAEAVEIQSEEILPPDQSDDVSLYNAEAGIMEMPPQTDREADIILEDVETVSPDSGGLLPDQTNNSNGADEILSGGGTSNTGQNPPISQADLDNIEKSVRDSYQQELSDARKKAETALAEKEVANAALAKYQQERLAASNTENAQTEQQLIANVKAAQDAYEDAALAANEAAVTSGRAVQAAGIPEASNSSDRMNEITYEQMELALQKLEALKKNGGKVCAPTDGLITKINILTGEKTTDTTAIMMADLSKGYRFTADLTEEQEKYIGVGDLVKLTGSKKQTLEDQPVETVTADEENDSIYHITVQMPENSFELGTAVTLEFVRKSETYSTCVPLSALHVDDKNQTYVLVTEEYDSIMGTETKARKVNVTVLEKNEMNAALAEGSITSQQEVIVSSDKMVSEGSRVRVQQ